MSLLKSNLIKPFRFEVLKKFKSEKETLKILDIGCGSHSSTHTKAVFKNCHYSGVDLDISYNNSKEDIENIDQFYKIDLTTLEYSMIPDGYFDVVILSHIIEHLHNGDKVILGMLQKLKVEGLIYIEFPSEKSVSFPSKQETLNFFDDPTHCRIFSLKEVCNLLMACNFRVLKAGKNSRFINILLMLVKIPLQFVTKGYVLGGVYWDYYGFADFVLAKRVQ